MYAQILRFLILQGYEMDDVEGTKTTRDCGGGGGRRGGRKTQKAFRCSEKKNFKGQKPCFQTRKI